jgi:hypothetical protein
MASGFFLFVTSILIAEYVVLGISNFYALRNSSFLVPPELSLPIVVSLSR